MRAGAAIDVPDFRTSVSLVVSLVTLLSGPTDLEDFTFVPGAEMSGLRTPENPGP